MSSHIRHAVLCAAVFATALGLSAATHGNVRTLKGYVTDTYCGFNRVNHPPTQQCTLDCVRQRHAKYAFFNFSDKKVYVLNPQSEAAKYAGQSVVVRGTVAGHASFATGGGPSSGAIITARSIAPAK